MILGDMDPGIVTLYYPIHHDGLKRYVRSRPGITPTLADDITSTTWERVLAGSHDPDLGTFQSWLYAIARNAIAEHWRTMTRRPETLDGDMSSWDAPDGSLDPGAALVHHWEIRHVQDAMQHLESGPQQQVITHRFFDGLSVADTARIMGKSSNAIKQLQVRALRNLTLYLDRDGNFTYDTSTGGR